ncbi:hypothetical protein [Caudoviricetes sp.]|nr:hypothetical protein [Caudoviricetes sp.]
MSIKSAVFGFCLGLSVATLLSAPAYDPCDKSKGFYEKYTRDDDYRREPYMPQTYMPMETGRGIEFGYPIR